MATSIPAVLRALGAADTATIPWKDLYADVEAAMAAGDHAALAALLDALALPEPTAHAPWRPATHLAEIAFRALAAVPGLEAARATLRRARWSAQPTMLAAGLARAHGVDELARLAAGPWAHAAERAVAAAWMHEAVYLGGRPGDHAAIAALAAALRAGGDPLGSVPLAQGAMEAALRKEPPVVRPLVQGSWSMMLAHEPTPTDARPAATIGATEVRDDAWAARVRHAFVPGGEPSNAKVEARRYALAAPIDAGLLGAPVLRVLAPDCITAPTAPEDVDEHTPPPHDPHAVEISAAPSSPEAIAATLLHMAIGWRCYGTYAGVGPGRARAWSALAAVCGLDDHAPWSAVEDALRRLRVARFTAATRWFEHIGEDVGFLVIDPTGTRLALVAETDSD